MLLFFVAFISGLFTIAAPCIWPILPIVLGSSISGGHKKPLGLTLGILISFGLITLTISYIARILPIDLNILRLLAVVVIAFLGVVLIIPKFSAILEAYLSRVLAKAGGQHKNGFLGGFLTGLSIGVVWTPCAGPILATIAALSITLSVSYQVILLTFFYLLGIGIPLFMFSFFGRRLFTKTRVFSRYTGRIQQLFGILMILTAIAILTNFDKTLQVKLLDKFPSYSNFLTSFESSAQNSLDQLRNTKTTQDLNTDQLFNASYVAPELVGITNWLNTPDHVSLSSLKGKVVLLDFWTYTCINCIRTLPHVVSWYENYKNNGFVVLGIHTPEFEFEKDRNNVEDAIRRYNISYPVAQDNNYATWDAYSNRYWPAHYLIDAKGTVRKVQFGEGDYDGMEKAIVALLNEAGQNISLKNTEMTDETPTSANSPETYIGLKGIQYSQFYPVETRSGKNGYPADYNLNETLGESEWSLGGRWSIRQEDALTIKDAKLNYNFSANKVFLVLKPNDNSPKKVKVYLDGKLISQKDAGTDVKNGIVTVEKDRLYNLVNISRHGNHKLLLEFENGIEVFAFTFG